ncbi:MAG: hypothetical protein QS2022_1720 [Candidatus Phytoplasma asteris]|uniref:hypothetical protein n=1 Tax='Chrysanthemum coronarium' phytoplasma TaxID=1520703 RepID=UPI0005A8C547|nr:hypothetical protein ['Chrysanthemum coronarium' phytoplasma]TKA88192.1 MAG: putative secreted protein [Periwinkle leaf yellowing phytoplasma]WEX19454.1 MAG: hypothetical protein QS2022_1720 [Candidatus Phytoplasma asteris]
MFIKKILSSLSSNIIFILLIIPLILLNYLIKFYLFTYQLSIQKLKQGIVVQFYQYLTTKQPNHVEIN